MILTLRLFAIFAALFVVAPSAQPLFAAEKATHRVAVHVDQNDPQVMNMALNNVRNLQKYYAAKGETVEIELVAYGPGLHMFRSDTSPVKERLAWFAKNLPSVTFSGCGNTHKTMSKKSGKDVPIVSQARLVPSGVVRLVELQEQGFSYIRP